MTFALFALPAANVMLVVLTARALRWRWSRRSDGRDDQRSSRSLV